MSIGLLLPFIILIGAMFLMTRSAKNKQRQAATMRNQMEPGSGVRTIGGMYAVVKEVNEDTVLLELADGVHAHFAKNSIGAVLDQAEYDRIVHGIEPPELEDGSEDADDDADTGTDEAAGTAGAADDERIDLSKTEDEPKKDGTDPK
ncbi:preprotein translocase subunit YajC [Streptomyces sp. H10-C2]|uniref:preprotein translocase subunit YajC n=1 Tax=unclassified Streptomyces TaxID=2593676 RepID=UPI0024BA3434|nr:MULTISPECIES: preprotein translocase subunit YajC [unclassified Streptomyces]MDJ0345295.1 preprotein translocase subunit YajC [Streptomyces sp. PH10-H1]MDJ0370746.1 preprotein translocase subunit YajC [Streptomyces sp. H10-C2]